MRTSTASTPSETRSDSSSRSSAEGAAPPDGRFVARPGVSSRTRAGLALQREVGRLTALFWVPALLAVMRGALGWRIVDKAAVHREYRAIRSRTTGPLLLCANHLTMVDSALIAWALGSPGWYLTNWDSVPWNTPERRNFADSPAQRALSYLLKCLPISRGGDRREVAAVLESVAYLLSRGEAVLIFPEGGRSRSGRVELANAAHGVGRIVGSVPGCRVLCVYLRGEHQHSYGDLPPRNERFHVKLSCIEPCSTRRGVRRSLDLAQQIVRELASLEERTLAEIETGRAKAHRP